MKAILDDTPMPEMDQSSQHTEMRLRSSSIGSARSITPMNRLWQVQKRETVKPRASVSQLFKLGMGSDDPNEAKNFKAVSVKRVSIKTYHDLESSTSVQRSEHGAFTPIRALRKQVDTDTLHSFRNNKIEKRLITNEYNRKLW